MTAATNLIGIDWGSTHVRAFRFDASGAVVQTRRGARGARGLAPSAYEGALIELLGDWLDTKPTKIIICGMAGSREGWIEVQYLACPCKLAALSDLLVRAPGALPAFLVPGLSTRGADGIHDVLRGEETQMLGVAEEGHAWLITPGTHSKWAEIRDGEIVRFHTYMTGELFSLLGSHSVLKRSLDVEGAFDAGVFDQGATRALEGGALTRLAFAVRAQFLFGALSPAGAKSYLSGLLIGVEIADALRQKTLDRFVLIGASDITQLYQRALALAGAADVSVVDGEHAAAHGLWRIAHGGRTP